jgi:molecular chaperone DnaK
MPLLALLIGCADKPDTVRPVLVETNTPAVGDNGTLQESIGIETLGGVFTAILPAGTGVPCSKQEGFSTAADNQDQILIRLFRGRASLAKECHPLGEFRVVGIPPAPRGGPSIEVTFAVQGTSILLSAYDPSRKQHMKIVRVDGSAGG